MRLVVTADDRSGAMEAAALCADAGLDPVVVVPWDLVPLHDRSGMTVEVVDLRSRHLTAARASARTRVTIESDVGDGLPRPPWRVHKIDSTLRGNWAAEIAAFAVAGRRVVLIPAYPAAGRTCVEGVVLVHGVPVADTEFARDPSSPVTSSRPADMLDRVDVSDVSPSRSHSADIDGWRGRVAVVDAVTDGDVERAVEAAYADQADDSVVVAGSAGVVGAVARRLAGPTALGRSPVIPRGDVLVVCGSRHAASRAQAAAAAAESGVTVLQPPPDLDAPPDVVALELAVRAHDHLAAHPAALVVLLGGDTTDAFVGNRPVEVHGSVGVGMALGTTVFEREQALVSKPGGFGATNVLVDLLRAR